MADLNKDWIKSVAKRTRDRISNAGCWSPDFIEEILVEELHKPFPEMVPIETIEKGQKFKFGGFEYTKISNYEQNCYEYYISTNWILCWMPRGIQVIPLEG